MLMSAAVLSDDDAVLAISHSGATRAVNDPVKLAARNGAKVIAITNYAESPIARNAHVVLNSTSQGSHLLGKTPRHALLSSTFWMHCLWPLRRRI